MTPAAVSHVLPTLMEDQTNRPVIRARRRFAQFRGRRPQSAPVHIPRPEQVRFSSERRSVGRSAHFREYEPWVEPRVPAPISGRGSPRFHRLRCRSAIRPTNRAVATLT